jgi:hypothetical protein
MLDAWIIEEIEREKREHEKSDLDSLHIYPEMGPHFGVVSEQPSSESTERVSNVTVLEISPVA